MTSTSQDYRRAAERFAELGVDAEHALATLATIAVSLHCWQGDDVGGFEGGGLTDGGILATGAYPGKARNPDELRADAEQVLSLTPGTHRFNLHASYLETTGPIPDRNEIEPAHFQRWIDWARSLAIGLDFNPTFFSHRLAAGGFTLAAHDEAIRRFWVEHGIACRRIGAAMGAALGSPCVTNIWIPDGMKDVTVDRLAPRQRLTRSLDEILAEPLDPAHNIDSVEAKLFGIGSETYVVGSHEFYLGYAARNNIALCLDSGHFHPTESVADKISSVMLSVPRLLLHISRGVRWDSDHVVLLTDDVRAIAQELARGGFLPRTHIGLDFFDASINRIAAWTLGIRNTLKALLAALLEPTDTLRALENDGDYTARLVLLERLKTMPLGDVWHEHCRRLDAPPDDTWLDETRAYERDILAKRA